MNSIFVDKMLETENVTKTDNGAKAYKSTNSFLLDLFGSIGAMRERSSNDIVSSFSKAFSEDKLLATKMCFYARDIREGLGERETPRIIWKWLACNYPDIMKKNLKYIPEFGRWDDMYCFVDTPIEEDMWRIIREQFSLDIEGCNNNKPISLMCKWLKSTNTSSKTSCELGRKTANALGFSIRNYQKILSKLRNYIKVTEHTISNNDWDKVKYSGVPSNAMKLYREAFFRHDESRFKEYLSKVSKGEEKINSSTLYPYDIVGEYMDKKVKNIDPVLEEQWKSLPNYIDGEHNIVVMADTSGSMYGTPLNSALGLAIYFAERNSGPFANVFMTFSRKPTFHKIVGNSLYEKIRNLNMSGWQRNTDFDAALNYILKVCVENNLKQEDVPKSLIVISDMQFDSCVWYNNTIYEKYVYEFGIHGYKIPNIVFWNVNSLRDTFQISSNVKGVQLVSGNSASTFKNLLKCTGSDPYELMLEVLNNARYSVIRV